jgi:ribosomal protein S6
MTYTVMTMICDECQKKIVELQTKLDIKDDALCALNLALDHAVEENRQLKDSRDNTVKMLKSVLSILDTKLHL